MKCKKCSKQIFYHMHKIVIETYKQKLSAYLNINKNL
jgi:hypothetical protein